ncbi:MAG TPA: hypothetical protein ENH85_01275 [Candidatus Scalindua sp.]|nr:hypothetical protein [Candidatus Scalindua sp.]
MAKLVIDNWLGGISFSDRLGREGSYFIGRAVNPINPFHLGYLCPGPLPVLISSTPTEVSSITVDDNKDKAYLLEGIRGGATKLHMYNFNSGNMSSTGDWPHSVPNSGEDTTIFQIGTTSYLLYSYYNNVGRATLVNDGGGARNFNDIFLSTNPAGASSLTGDMPHPMLRWGESGFLYIADGRSLHQFDGQTGDHGTLTTGRLQLPVGWIITSLFDAGEYIGITAKYMPSPHAVERRQKTEVFFWDGTSSSFNLRKPISDKQIIASIAKDGEYFTFGVDDLEQGTIKKFDGARFVSQDIMRTNRAVGTTITKFARRIEYGAVRGYRSVDTIHNMIIFGASLESDADIFLYGSPQEGLPPALFNLSPPNLTDVTQTKVFAIKVSKGDEILFSAQAGAVNYFSKISLADANNPYFLYKSFYFEFPKRTRINYVKCHFKALASGEGDDILLDLDYGNRQIHAGNISYAEDKAITEKRLGVKKNCDNFRLVIQPDEGVGIKYGKIIVDYTLLETDVK